MTVLFDNHEQPTVIPDAKWYFVEGKLCNMNEHLVKINTPPPKKPKLTKKAKGKLVTPAQAADILGCDQKKIRRMIRSGKLPARREGGRWVILRSDLG
jgi:excisionase family DNA binding protein